MEELVNEAGGIIVGKMAVLAEGDANDRPDITGAGQARRCLTPTARRRHNNTQTFAGAASAAPARHMTVCILQRIREERV